MHRLREVGATTELPNVTSLVEVARKATAHPGRHRGLRPAARTGAAKKQLQVLSVAGRRRRREAVHQVLHRALHWAAPHPGSRRSPEIRAQPSDTLRRRPDRGRCRALRRRPERLRLGRLPLCCLPLCRLPPGRHMPAPGRIAVFAVSAVSATSVVIRGFRGSRSCWSQPLRPVQAPVWLSSCIAVWPVSMQVQRFRLARGLRKPKSFLRGPSPGTKVDEREPPTCRSRHRIRFLRSA